MAKVTFKKTSGESVVVEALSGTLMEIALDHDIPGISGDCGGVCSCSTCHLYVAPTWMDKVGPAADTELDALEFNGHQRPNSRLGCQINLTEDLDGLVVEVAPSE